MSNLAITKELTDLKDDDSRKWAQGKGGWKNGSSATLTIAAHTGLIVKFEGSDKPVFTTVESKPEPPSDGIIESVMEFLGDVFSFEPKGSGFTFVTSDGDALSLATQPIYHVRDGASEGSIDIAGIMRAIGAVGAVREGGLKGENIGDHIDGLKHMIDGFLIHDDVADQGELLDNKPKPADSCSFCHEIAPPGEMKHVGPILETKRTFTPNQLKKQ